MEKDLKRIIRNNFIFFIFYYLITLILIYDKNYSDKDYHNRILELYIYFGFFISSHSIFIIINIIFNFIVNKKEKSKTYLLSLILILLIGIPFCFGTPPLF